MNIYIVIPARFASTRFPGKPLVLIHGKPMIQCVYEQALKAKGIAGVVVATDDEKIKTVVEGFGGKVVMTSPDHQSGTDRCAEVLEVLGAGVDAIINVQGDEPFIHPEQIEQVATLLNKHNIEIATLARKADSEAEIADASKVKVVFDKNGKALYFSRSIVPYNRTQEPVPYFVHVGIYGYSADALRDITDLQISSLEKAESLEQLRWLQNGFPIHLDITPHKTIGIDTPEDLQNALLKG